LLIDPTGVDTSFALTGERVCIALQIGARRAPYLAALGARGTIAESGAVTEQTGIALLALVPLYDPLEAAGGGAAPAVLLLIVPAASPVDPLAPGALTAIHVVVPVLAAQVAPGIVPAVGGFTIEGVQAHLRRALIGSAHALVVGTDVIGRFGTTVARETWLVADTPPAVETETIYTGPILALVVPAAHLLLIGGRDVPATVKT